MICLFLSPLVAFIIWGVLRLVLISINCDWGVIDYAVFHVRQHIGTLITCISLSPIQHLILKIDTYEKKWKKFQIIIKQNQLDLLKHLSQIFAWSLKLQEISCLFWLFKFKHILCFTWGDYVVENLEKFVDKISLLWNILWIYVEEINSPCCPIYCKVVAVAVFASPWRA